MVSNTRRETLAQTGGDDRRLFFGSLTFDVPLQNVQSDAAGRCGEIRPGPEQTGFPAVKDAGMLRSNHS